MNNVNEWLNMGTSGKNLFLNVLELLHSRLCTYFMELTSHEPSFCPEFFYI